MNQATSTNHRVGPIATERGAHPRRTSRSRRRDERGSITPFVVVIIFALFAVASLVIDGGYGLAAKRKAMNVAEQAARAGADALDPAALRSGETRVNPHRARTAARDYLDSVDASGTVEVNGGEVTVTVTTQYDTAMFSAVGLDHLTISATATAISIDQND